MVVLERIQLEHTARTHGSNTRLEHTARTHGTEGTEGTGGTGGTGVTGQKKIGQHRTKKDRLTQSKKRYPKLERIQLEHTARTVELIFFWLVEGDIKTKHTLYSTRN